MESKKCCNCINLKDWKINEIAQRYLCQINSDHFISEGAAKSVYCDQFSPRKEKKKIKLYRYTYVYIEDTYHPAGDSHGGHKTTETFYKQSEWTTEPKPDDTILIEEKEVEIES